MKPTCYYRVHKRCIALKIFHVYVVAPVSDVVSGELDVALSTRHVQVRTPVHISNSSLFVLPEIRILGV